MFCPSCRDEYREGFLTCADCGVALVEELPPEPEPEAADYVTVFETGSQSLVAVVRSILDGAQVPYVAKNETLQNLFGMGPIGAGFNVAMGPVRFRVPRQRAREARELLTELPVAEDDES